MKDFRIAEPDQYAAINAMIPLAEGQPAVVVDEYDQSIFVCRRISGLHVAEWEWTFYGKCEYVDPAESRPEEMTDGMAISCDSTCLKIGPGWWKDAYFGWFFIYDRELVAQSLAGNHSWLAAFLRQHGQTEAGPGAAAAGGRDSGSS